MNTSDCLTACNQAPEEILSQELCGQLDERHISQKRNIDTFGVFNRKRNANAYIMLIVFIIIYPLRAISISFPIGCIPYLKNSYFKNKIMALHAPTQVIGFVMMIGGMALGIRIGHDLDYLNDPVHAHVVIGLIVSALSSFFNPSWAFFSTGISRREVTRVSSPTYIDG
jgi:hypothetical protein